MEQDQRIRVRTLKKKVEENSVILEEIVNSIVAKYNKDLERFVSRMQDLLKRSDKFSDHELENAVLKIPVFYYFAVGGLESLGIEGDTAKAHKIEVFNKAFEEVQGTIEDKKKHAELSSFPEYLVEVAYARAYKKLKAQLEAAEHIFSGAKKVLSKRMIEMEINSRDNGGAGMRPRRNRDDD